MQRDEILLRLQQNMDEHGRSQFTYSTDLSVKRTELIALKSLEAEGYIKLLSAALGYAIYRVL